MFVSSGRSLMAQMLPLTVHAPCTPTACTTNSFTTVETTTQGRVWNSSPGQGLCLLHTATPTAQWASPNQRNPHNIQYLKQDANGGVGVAQAGYSGGEMRPTNGGAACFNAAGTTMTYDGPLSSSRSL
ncbi:hypothetical protein A8B98_22115 [Hymenobacter sp. UV11]|nr:hypothetical protein A8B98_22115 [Hymenobacter sp. UV11]